MPRLPRRCAHQVYAAFGHAGRDGIVRHLLMRADGGLPTNGDVAHAPALILTLADVRWAGARATASRAVF